MQALEGRLWHYILISKIRSLILLMLFFQGRSNINGLLIFVLKDGLGWRVTYDSENLRVLELGDHRFYLQRYYQQEWCDNTMLHISVESVDDWFEFVTGVFASQQFAGNARHSDRISDEGYGRVFHIWDPAGVLLHIAQFHD